MGPISAGPAHFVGGLRRGATRLRSAWRYSLQRSPGTGTFRGWPETRHDPAPIRMALFIATKPRDRDISWVARDEVRPGSDPPGAIHCNLGGARLGSPRSPARATTRSPGVGGRRGRQGSLTEALVLRDGGGDECDRAQATV